MGFPQKVGQPGHGCGMKKTEKDQQVGDAWRLSVIPAAGWALVLKYV
jgi:hypothetical protein